MTAREPDSTSFKNYPLNKYCNLHSIEAVSRKVFRPSTGASLNPSQQNTMVTIDRRTKRSTSMIVPKQKRSTKEASTKRNTTKLETAFMVDISEELDCYKKLCLELRRKNEEMKKQLQISKQANVEALSELQKKVTKFAEESKKRASMKKSVPVPATPAIKTRSKDLYEYKSWCQATMECLGLIEPKLVGRFREARSINSKMMVSRCALSEITQFLMQNRFKFDLTMI